MDLLITFIKNYQFQEQIGTQLKKLLCFRKQQKNTLITLQKINQYLKGIVKKVGKKNQKIYWFLMLEYMKLLEKISIYYFYKQVNEIFLNIIRQRRVMVQPNLDKIIISIILTLTITKCFVACPEGQSLSQIYCSCNERSFSLAGKCITPLSPCSASYITYIDSQDPKYKSFNLWERTIAPFLIQKFSNIKNQNKITQVPAFLNNYNFNTMSNGQRILFIQGYYYYKSLQQFIKLLSNQEQQILLIDLASLATTFQSKNYIEIWQQINNFANQKFKKAWELDQFTTLVEQNVKLVMPCHQCVETYGPIQTSSSTICTKCPPNCLSCSDEATVCDSCLQRYWLNSNSVCQKCSVPDCLECQADGSCILCQSGKVLSNNTCLTCSDNCVSCQEGNPSDCLQCHNLLYSSLPTDSGACRACTQHQCLTCDSANPSICRICGAGYYSDDNFQCQKCSQNCIGCTKSECYSCDYGYGLVNKVCRPCKMKNCLKCDYGIEKCNFCSLPYFQLNPETKICQITTLSSNRCRSGCSVCYDNTQLCFSCEQRYYLQDRHCKKCMPGCLNCKNRDTCYKCDLGYTLTNGVCIECPLNCKNCWSASVCVTCFERYVFNSNKQCVLAPNKNCMFFDETDTTQCLMCKPGYTLTAKNDCIRCLTGSIWSCSPQNISKVEKNRFELNNWYFNEYNLGGEGCYLELNNQCIQPDSRYKIVLINGTYYAQYKCLYPCSTCNFSQITQCFSCEPDYSLIDGRCIPLSSCNPNCKSCPLGSHRNPNSNRCQVCSIANCGSCLFNQCLECYQGYYLEGVTCKVCPQKCKSCYDSKNCKQCARGYVKPAQWTSLEGKGDCVICNPNCLTCRFEESICTSCSDKMILVDNRCISKTQIKFEYTLNIPPKQFMDKTINQRLLDQIAKDNGFDPDQLLLEDITQVNQNGVVVIKGIIPVNDINQGNKIIEELNKNRPSQLNVANSSFFLTQVQQIPCPTCMTQPQQGKIKAVTTGLEQGAQLLHWLWIVCGSILGIITCLTIIFAVYRYRVKKKQKQLRQQEQNRATTSIKVTEQECKETTKYIVTEGQNI